MNKYFFRSLAVLGVAIVGTIALRGRLFSNSLEKSQTKESTRVEIVSEEKNPNLWKQINESLRDLINRQNEPGVAPVQYKKIQKIVLAGKTALVVYSESQYEEPVDLTSELYSLNLETNERKRLRRGAGEPFGQWRVLKVVGLKDFGSGFPEIVVEFQTCTDCEPEFLWSTIFYDIQTQHWEIASWGTAKEILINSTAQHGDEDYETNCIHGILDVTGDHIDDMAVRCELKGLTSGKTEKSLFVYTVSNGSRKELKIDDADQVVAMTKELCRVQPTETFCK